MFVIIMYGMRDVNVMVINFVIIIYYIKFIIWNCYVWIKKMVCFFDYYNFYYSDCYSILVCMCEIC